MQIHRVNSKERVTGLFFIRFLRHYFLAFEKCLFFGKKWNFDKLNDIKNKIFKFPRVRKPISYASILILFLLLSISWNFQFSFHGKKHAPSHPFTSPTKPKELSLFSNSNSSRIADPNTLIDVEKDDSHLKDNFRSSFFTESGHSKFKNGNPGSKSESESSQEFDSRQRLLSGNKINSYFDFNVSDSESGPSNDSIIETEILKESFAKKNVSKIENVNSNVSQIRPNSNAIVDSVSPLTQKISDTNSASVNFTKIVPELPVNLTFVPEETWGQNWNWTDIQTWQQNIQNFQVNDERFNYSNWKSKVKLDFNFQMINDSYDTYETGEQVDATEKLSTENISGNVSNFSNNLGNGSRIVSLNESLNFDFVENDKEANIFENFLGLVGGSIRWSKNKVSENVNKFLFFEQILKQNIYDVYIPGTDIKTIQKVKRVKSALTCLATVGEWVFNNTPRQIPWDLHPPLKVNNPDYRTCDFLWLENGGAYGAAAEKIRGNRNRKIWNVRSPLKYEWKSTSELCNFRKFDRAKFCAAVGRRNILLVGDSMQLQFHNAILNHVVTNETARSAGVMGDARFPCMGHDLCGDVLGGKGFHFLARRNDKLTRGNGDVYDNMKWIDHIEKYRIEMLIINRGAHFRENDIFLREMREILLLLRRKYPNLLIIWRNTPPGHPHCFAKKYRTPLKARLKLSELKYFFGWDKFQSQNEVARSLMEEFGVVYMDIDHATALRPDGHFQKYRGHRDCLHYCSPGPIDFWVHLLYNILVELNN